MDNAKTRARVRAAVLAWYDAAARDLPWRIGPRARAAGVQPDPYKVWLSEIMLQQTTVAAVGGYFAAFTARWPNVAALAAAPREAVLEAWAGLGYYSRARNLHAAAQQLAREGFPADEAGWRALPGVGPYTAAAIASIALDQPANVVDGNVERVMARWHAHAAPLPGAKPALRALAGRFVSAERPGDWAQALMDLGATICTPRAPRCEACPAAFTCRAKAEGAAAAYPKKAAKPAKPERHGVAFRLSRRGAVLLVRRPDQGLLGGMLALPSTPWREAAWTWAEAAAHAPLPQAQWRRIGVVRHVFTHFALSLEVFAAEGAGVGEWVAAGRLSSAGLPTVFRKAAMLAAD